MSARQRRDFASRFKPAVNGQSDKFSWRFYKRILKNGREKIYLSAWCMINGAIEVSLRDLDGFVSAGRIAVGYKSGADHFVGSKMSTICTERASTQDWAFYGGHNVSNWLDITSWFWENYERHGRCMFYNSVHSWIIINRNSRKCEYCGKHERRTVETVKTVKRYVKWSPITSASTT